ncbi:MAG: enoyl-CoA hydratase [Alphaproteobacteria bacterium]|nr:enoyl-CoA hydratase [Alphaproteobacteria bacterium]
MTDKMLSHKRGGIGIMTFNNPEKHNAVSLEMWEAVERILADFVADPEIRVVVVTGAGGKAFVSGADISKFESERASEEAVARYNATVDRMYGTIYDLPKPTIAMIRGFCIGGGLGLAVACDMRFCTEASSFSLPAAKLGLGYGFNGLKRFVDLVGPSRAKEIFYSARRYGAAEALAMGLVNYVLPDGELDKAVEDMAATIADNAPLTVAAVKRIVQETVKDPERRDLAACERAVAACFASQDYVEGRRAFMEKRKPRFLGR